VLHQAADVVDVTAEPVELRHDDRCFALAGERDRSIQLWASVVGPALGLDEGLQEAEALGLGKLDQRGLLRLQA
jgi:hypothetical protein